MYNPILDEMFSAISGHGAKCNGKPIKVSNNVTGTSIDNHQLANSIKCNSNFNFRNQPSTVDNGNRSKQGAR